MVVIENKEIKLDTVNIGMSPLDKDGNRKPLFYKYLIEIAVRNRPNDGFDVSEMRKRMRILDVTEVCKENERMQFEDSYYETLKDCVVKMKWAVIDRGIDKFIQDIENASNKVKT